MKRKGFTLIEILAVIVILGILTIIAVPIVSNYIVDSRNKTYSAHEKNMEEAAKSFTIECIDGKENCILPMKDTSSEIYLSELIEKGFTERLQNPQGSGYCNEELSYVRVLNTGKSDYEYQACLYCGNYVTESNNCVAVGEISSGSAPVCGSVTGQSSEWTNKPRTITVACTDPDNDCRYNTYPKTFKTTTVNDQIIIGDMKNHITRCPVDVKVDTDLPTCELEVINESEENQTNMNWLSGNVVVKIKNYTDAHSGLLTYGMGISTNPDYNRKTQLDLTNVSGIVTVFGYVKDNAGNESTCRTTIRTGIQKPDFDIYYGYHIFPQKEQFSTDGITVNNGAITTSGTTHILTFDNLNKYTNVARVVITPSGTVNNTTDYKLSVDNGSHYITALPRHGRIEFDIPKGTYSKYIFDIPNNVTIDRIELQNSRNNIVACKNVSVNLHPDVERERVKTTGFSFDNGATFQDKYYKLFDVRNNAVSGIAQTRFDIGMVSDKKNYSIVKGDCSGPDIELTYSPTGWTNGNVTLTGKGTDNGSGIIAFDFKKGSSTPYDSNEWTYISNTNNQVTKTETIEVNGTYFFNLKDEAGNIIDTSKNVTNIDKVKPVCKIEDNTNSKILCTDSASSDGNYSASSIDKYIFGKDATTSSSWTDVTATNSYSTTATVNAAGTWNLYAHDRAGNISDKVSYTYYDVTYDKNGGSSCTKSSDILRSGMPIDLTPTCTRTGYTFKGWKNSSGAAVTSMNISGNTTLYARWEANTYTIKFNGNGNTSGSTADVTCTYDSNCTLTANGFAKTGHSFSGWATSATGAKVYDDQASVSNLAASSTYNLYAKWGPNTYSITYNYDSGTAPSSGVPASYTYGVGATVNGSPTRSGYTFNGWNNGTSNAFSHTIGTDALGNKSFTALWCQNCASVSHGSCSLDASTAGTCTYTATCDPGYYVSSGAGTRSPVCTYKEKATITCLNPRYNEGSQTIATCAGGTVANATKTDEGSYTVSCTGDSSHNNADNKTCSILHSVAVNTVDGVTTGYASLQAAINASKTGTTKLLENTTEDISIHANGKTINLNNKTLTGPIVNGSNSTITINKGTITRDSGWTISNHGTMTTNKLNVYHNNSNDNGCGVMNSGTLSFSNGYVYSKAHVFATSGDGAVARIYSSTLEGVGNGVAMWSRLNSHGYVYNSTIKNGSICSHEWCAADSHSTLGYPAYPNDYLEINNCTTSSATYYGSVHYFKKVDNSTYQIGIKNRSVDSCPTWTVADGQDDLKWHSSSSGICTIKNSDHGNQTGAYITHIYSGNKHVATFSYDW